MTKTSTKKSLDGLRVLDLSRVLAGPYCTQILGDLGAEIIKIEKPGAGDDTRFWGPPFLKDRDGKDTTESAYYLSANRNKKSVAIDMKTEGGRRLIRELLKKSDILIQNFKTGGLDAYGLGYDQLKEEYPHLIYCAITGFGLDGPLAYEAGYDYIAQAMGGLMACTGDADGEPMKVGVALSDIITGLNAAIGILAALHHREKTGKGQLVDVALVDCTLAALTNIAQYYLTSGQCAPRLGNAHSTIVPYQVFEAQDGFIVIAVGNDGQFRRFCDFIKKPEWAGDERFARNSARVINREILVPQIRNIVAGQPMQYWLEGLKKADVPCGPVNTMDKVFAMDQVRHRKMEIAMNHSYAPQPVRLVGNPIKLSDTPAEYNLPPPVLGEHTQEVLEKFLGLGADEIAGLEKEGAVARAKGKR